MGHQPFEDWILDDQALTAEQSKELNSHLATCYECQKLHNSLAAATVMLKTSSTAYPRPGFTLRWKELQAQRLAARQRRQTRIFFFSAILGALAALGGLITLLDLSGVSFQSLFVSAARLVAGLMNAAGDARFYVGASLSSPLPLAIWILISVGFCLLVFVWVYTLWRISLQGVHQHEKSI